MIGYWLGWAILGACWAGLFSGLFYLGAQALIELYRDEKKPQVSDRRADK